jgi:hypothetical protein
MIRRLKKDELNFIARLARGCARNIGCTNEEGAVRSCAVRFVGDDGTTVKISVRWERQKPIAERRE